MKKEYYEKLSYGYQYNTSNSLRKEIEQIRRIQEENEKETKIQKVNNFLKRISIAKRNSNLQIYPEAEFLGI